ISDSAHISKQAPSCGHFGNLNAGPDALGRNPAPPIEFIMQLCECCNFIPEIAVTLECAVAKEKRFVKIRPYAGSAEFFIDEFKKPQQPPIQRLRRDRLRFLNINRDFVRTEKKPLERICETVTDACHRAGVMNSAHVQADMNVVVESIRRNKRNPAMF